MVEQINEYARGDSINNSFKKNNADGGPLFISFPSIRSLKMVIIIIR